MNQLLTHLRRRVLLAGAGLLLSLAAAAQGPTVDPAFAPTQITKLINGVPFTAMVNDVLRLPDGSYLIGGDFQTVNGQPARHLARLLPDGRLDAVFTAATAPDGPVRKLLLLPDGRILVGGTFQTLAGAPRPGLGRLLPTGALDAGFAPALTAPASGSSAVGELALQPDGRLLVAGTFVVPGTSAEQQLVRLDGSTGQHDPSFQYALPTPDSRVSRLLLLPDGKVLVSGTVPAYRSALLLGRLLPNGAEDSSFPRLLNLFTSGINSLELDAAGRIYAGGSFNSGGSGNGYLRRYLPDGSLDRNFNYAGRLTQVNAVAVQPNGRVLLAGNTTERVLPDGTVDASYVSANGPTGNALSRLLVQPDGAIMVAGTFTLPGSTGQIGLVRLLDAQVLPVRHAAASARLAAWPVPAREVLHVRLDAPAQRVQLLDALGRTVRSSAPAATLSIPVADLLAGTYQLQVELTDGSRAVRRVVLQ
jgi:uncharacterized delta-60 repeat protein